MLEKSSNAIDGLRDAVLGGGPDRGQRFQLDSSDDVSNERTAPATTNNVESPKQDAPVHTPTTASGAVMNANECHPQRRVTPYG